MGCAIIQSRIFIPKKFYSVIEDVVENNILYATIVLIRAKLQTIISVYEFKKKSFCFFQKQCRRRRKRENTYYTVYQINYETF